MNFELRKPSAREKSVYKTLYISRSLVEQIDKIAVQNGTSFNNVIISMIESCLKEK